MTELLEDYKDFLRQRGHMTWQMNDPRALEARKLVYKTDKSYKTYMHYMDNPESAANAMVCLINQTNYLLDRQLAALEKDYMKKGDFKEREREYRKKQIWNR